MLTTEKKNRKEEKSSLTVKKVIHPQQDGASTQLKAEKHEVRYLKLKCFYRTLGPDARIVPDLHLCGGWLEKAGFIASNYVSVTVMDKLLIIRTAENMEKP